MAESLLIKISLILSLVGIALLILISDRIKIKEYPINSLTKELLEKDIKVIGEITNIQETPGLLILTIKDKTKSIKVILYKEDKKIKLVKGLKVEVTGKLKTYKKEYEIEAEEIKVL